MTKVYMICFASLLIALFFTGCAPCSCGNGSEGSATIIDSTPEAPGQPPTQQPTQPSPSDILIFISLIVGIPAGILTIVDRIFNLKDRFRQSRKLFTR